jgi:putative inorganic carbon (hco3(-)) transporter
MKKIEVYITAGIAWAYQALFLITPLLFTWFNEELFEFNKMLFVYSIATLVGGLWVLRSIARGKFEWKRTAFDLPIAIFILSQLFSTLFSIHLRTSLFGYYSRFHGGLFSTLSYAILFAVFVQTFSAKQIWRFIKTAAISALLVCAVAIPEHFGHSLSCVFINSSQLTETLPVAEVFSPPQLWHSYNAECWRQDVQNRVFATFGQPNWLAAYAITLLPLFMVLASIRKGKERWLYGAASVCLFITLLFTKSRSGILGWGAGVGWLGMGVIFWAVTKQKTRELWQKHRQTFLPIIGIFCALIVCAAWFGTPYTPALVDVIKKTHTTEQPVESTPVDRLEAGGTDSGEIRKIVWTGALKVWQRYPILGSGVETFAYSYYTDRPMVHNLVSEWDFLYNKAHNEFLNFLATTGIVGLASYSVFLGFCIFVPLYFIWKNKTTDDTWLVLLALSSGLVSLTISNALGFSTVMVSVLLFIFPAWTWILHQATVTGKKPIPAKKSTKKVAQITSDTPLTFRQKMWSLVVGLMMCFVLILIWRSWRADYLLARGKYLQELQEYEEALNSLEFAYQLSSGEGIFSEKLAETYSWFSAAFMEMDEATAAAAFRFEAKSKADEMLQENPHNINFYKTRGRVLVTLAPQEPELLLEAKKTFEQATLLAPTDPRLRYSLGLLQLSLGDIGQAQAELEKAIEMKPNFEEGRMSLAKIYAEQQQWQKAVTEYQYILDKIQPRNDVARTEIERLNLIIATSSATTKTQPATKK